MDRSGNGGNKNENQERQQSLLDGSLWEQSNSEILVTLFREYTKKVNLQEVGESKHAAVAVGMDSQFTFSFYQTAEV